MKRRAFIARATAAAVGATLGGRVAETAPRWIVARGRRSDVAEPDNLLRNATFQDDWLTRLPTTQTLHWTYPYAFYNRRDFNPDGWRCRGSWEWLDADRPNGARRFVLRGPGAEARQRLPWIAVHDESRLTGSPDAGGFPELRPHRSRTPDRLVRDLTLRVLVHGDAVPDNAGAIEVGLGPLGGATAGDPLGAVVAPLVSSTTPLPSGTYDWRWIEARLPAAAWLAAASRLPADAAQPGSLLPAVVSVAIRYAAAAGSIEIRTAHLSAANAAGTNLIANGAFTAVDGDGYPVGWGRPVKYRYFPPREFYLFNTWHNARFDNRGLVERDRLVTRSGTPSLKMVVPSGDEVAVASAPIAVNQRAPRLIEVTARVKTDRLCMLDLDAVDASGARLDGFRFVHKAPVSIGSDGWRVLRQVFRPRTPVVSFRLMLCARGANGYTLDATGIQPHNNVVGTVWWDEIRVVEPESTAREFAARGVKPTADAPGDLAPYVEDVDLGERLLGDNVLAARVVNPGRAATFALAWSFTSPTGKRSARRSAAVRVAAGGDSELRVPYTLDEPCATAYTEYRGELALLRDGATVATSALWFTTWAVPIDVRLGALYLKPEQRQLVRVNLGFSAATMRQLASVRFEIVRRRSGEAVQTSEIAATRDAIRAQRERIPAGLRGDFTNLLLADLDVSALPIQPFDEPDRRWLVRATALDRAHRGVATVDSPPFCRQAPAPAQPPVRAVAVGRDGVARVNGEPWMPWGGVYGFAPAYAGPADPGAGGARDLRALPEWSLYDRLSPDHYMRRANDFNAARDVAGTITPRGTIEQRWNDDNRYSSTAFVAASPAFSTAELTRQAGGPAALAAHLDFIRSAPMVVSTAPGIEEAFGLFHGATAPQLAGLRDVVESIRRATGKPVMVGHGGYWNRFEFEKVPYFDIYDPETEPFYPANLHTDLAPLVRDQAKAIWLRPQMYEDVPYERWRFHVYVELMRGCRGWQIAHGPGDASLARGLHGELAFMRPIAASSDAGPTVTIEPWIEHWSRRYRGKTYVIAATTRGIAFGRWRPGADAGGAIGRARVTDAPREPAAYAAHGIQYLPSARAWPSGTRLVQWVRLDPGRAPRGVLVVVKADGRFTHATSAGAFDVAAMRRDAALWFLETAYPHATGFLGWDDKRLGAALPYVPATAVDLGARPAPGTWTRLEVPLDAIGAAGKLVDGVGFVHPAGRAEWGRTSIVGPNGEALEVWGDTIALAPERLARTKISVAGLRAGTRVRALFEDRELRAADGHFVDDFRGQDLYQRFGGGPTHGYGDAPVALHVYEIG